jgi:hypothetical protein
MSQAVVGKNIKDGQLSKKILKICGTNLKDKPTK